jgi:ribonuclease-3
VELATLEHELGYAFTDPTLLRRAMCHRSWVAEADDDEESNERLEFLGDAVLGWVIADLVYHRFADLPEGKMTDLRKSVVNANALAAIADGLGLGDHLLLGRGEAIAGGREKVSILSDAMEAVLGAAYLDGGRSVVFGLIERLFLDRLREAVGVLHRLDHKSALQELVGQQGRSLPDYLIRSTGPDHDKTFFADVLVDGTVLGSGTGRTKKAAEMSAAEAAYDALVEH